MSEFVTVIEHITFLPSGGSRHVCTLEDGSIWKTEDFEVSPILFFPWPLKTAAEAHVLEVTRRTKVSAALINSRQPEKEKES